MVARVSADDDSQTTEAPPIVETAGVKDEAKVGEPDCKMAAATAAAADIPSRLSGVEPKESALNQDIIALAVYFAKVGFNTGLLIKNPFSAKLSEELDHEHVMRLVDKYNLKMNLDKSFRWITHPPIGLKLRIYHIALTYPETFIDKAAAQTPLDFCEERFWKCAKSHDYWRACRSRMKRLNGFKRRDVRAKHSSSRLLSVAILPLLNENEKNLIKICALGIEVRKGPPDRNRFNHFMRECLRHVRADILGRACPKEKRALRDKFNIQEAHRELGDVNENDFLELWEKSSDKNVTVRFDEHVSRPICVKHLEQIEADKLVREEDLRVLARHFCRLDAEQALIDCRAYESPERVDLSQQALNVTRKYNILFSPLINQFSIKKYHADKAITIDGVAREHLQLFIDTAALSSLGDLAQGAWSWSCSSARAEEEQFWRCANNFSFWQKYNKLARKCLNRDNKCRLAPARLTACGFYRLLTINEPKLIELCSLRAPTEEQYEYFKHNILYQIREPLDASQAELKRLLRARYKVEDAERQLKPIDLGLFLKLRRLDQDKCFGATTSLLAGVKYEHAAYLKRIEPDDERRARDLAQLAAYFNKPCAVFLLNNHNHIRNKLEPIGSEADGSEQAGAKPSAEAETFKLAYKYHVIYSRVCHTFEPAKFLVRLHRLASDHLALFIDSAALASPRCLQAADEKRFWWCAGNLAYLSRHAQALTGAETADQLLQAAPSRLVSIATHRLLTQAEPKLTTLVALRAAVERPDRWLQMYHYEALKKSIESVNEKLAARADRKLIQELRLRYRLDQAERELEPISVDLFIERWNATTKHGGGVEPTKTIA